MSQFVDNTLGIDGGAFYDPSSGNTAIQSFGPSGCISIEDQNDYAFAVFDPNTGHAFIRSGDTISGSMRVESVCGELFFDDGFFNNYTLSEPGERELVDLYQKHSIVGNFNEIANKVSFSASPGFTWGKSGVVTSSTYLLNDSVPSNKTGRRNFLSNSELVYIYTSNELSTTYSIDIIEHDKVTFTVLGTYTVVSDYGDDFYVSGVYLTTGKELAVRISPSSANNPKEVVAGVLIKGDLL